MFGTVIRILVAEFLTVPVAANTQESPANPPQGARVRVLRSHSGTDTLLKPDLVPIFDVAFSIFVQGLSMAPLLRRLGEIPR